MMSRTRRGRRFFGSGRTDLFVTYEFVMRLPRSGEQLLERGREEGLEHERFLLRRMAASRFGAGTAERLSEVLAHISEPERMAEVGEWLVRCDTGAELLARVEPAPAERDPDGA